MMKKIFLLVTFFVLGKMWSYAQYPITQNIGSDSTIVVSKGALQSRLINVTYPDTATANLQRIRQYPGAQIATTSGGINLWVRNTTATAWLPINTGSGNNIYTIDGTLTGNRTLTGNNYSLTFTGLSQFLLTVGNQTFTVRSDSASLTRKLSYASNRGSTFTLYSLVDKNYVDSAIASSPAGTVTQINTNNNTGITGGPITSTGTLAIDTLLISTRAWRQKGVDSLQANINLKLNIVDTTGMLANYVNSVGYGLGKTSQTVYVDSASLSNYYLRRKDSLTATNPLGYVTQKILADTAAAIRSSDLGGTVTSVATNNGTGITGGTITTSGTLAIDTTIISTRAWRQKGVDSLQANINLKLNISDTASMLNPYLRKVDTASLSNRINQKLNISDTASMLSPYLRSNTAAATYVPQTRTLTINGTTQDLSANRTYNVGTVTSVGLTMPAAFNVANSPVTGSGTLAVTGAGLASQYIRGDGTLANFPGGGGGGGASVSYYLNGSVNQGTFGGNTYYQMNKTPILGAGTNFTTNTNGYIAQFITNAGDPALLNIPAGNWNFELFFSASSGGGTPSYYVELYKYDGTTFTLIASGSSNPDVIVNSAVDAYFSALPVPQTTLTLTDRLAVRIYVTHAGRTITLHTEDNNLCQVVTTFTTGITAINSLTAQVQYLTTGTSGTDFNISSLTDTHTFNLPVASGTNTGKLSNTDWTTFNNKVGGSLVNGYITKATGTNTIDTSQLFQSNGLIGIGTTSPTQKLQVSGNAYVNGQLFAGDTALSVYQVEGILNTPYVLGRKAVNNTLSTEARPTGVMGHVVGRGSIANRLQAANFYTTTDSASTANSTGSLRSVNAWTAHNGSGSLATAWGSYNIVQNKTTGTITNAYGSVSGVENRGATSTINKLHGTTTEIWNNYGGTIDTAFGQVISIYNNNAASNIGAVYGLSIGKGLITPTGGTHYWRNSGTIGTSYGLYLDSSIDVGTTKYALFSNSNSDSYLRGNLGLGTTTPGGRLAIVDTGGFALKINYNSASTDANNNAALYAENNGLSSYVAILNEKTTNNTGGQYPILIESSLTSGTAQSGMATGIHFGVPDDAGNRKVTQLALRTTDPAAATYTNRAELRLWNNGSLSTPYYLLGNGNMGLGTATPDSNLTVVNGALFQRGVRMSGLPSAPGTKALRINASGTISIADTLIDAGGTVTSVATNNGTGITGGTITTSGTLAIDTLLISTRAWRQKGVDSVAALANTKVSGSLISGYIPKATGTLTVDTSQIYQNNGNIGIGTISPASGFKVDMTGSLRVGNGSSYNNITINGNSGAGSYLRFQKNGTNKGDIGPYSAVLGGVPPYSGSNDDLTYSSVGGHFFNTNAGVKMYLNNAGNLGLSASPDSMLTVLEGAYFQRGVRMSGLPSAPGTRALRINANGTLSVADTLVDAGGTVTSVATNNGTGITGGTITTTGTLAIDTLRISTRAWRQKGIDSVAALINSNVSGTTNYVAKFTGTNTIGNSQLFDNGTNVGIGTTSPAYKLQAVVDNSYNTLVIAATSLNGVVTGGLTFGGIYNSDNLNFYSGGSFTTKMVLNNSGNLGLGVAPSGWVTSKAIQYGTLASISGFADLTNDISFNAYYDGAWKYIQTGREAYRYRQIYGSSGGHIWDIATSGTAGSAISFTQAMTLDVSGNLLLGMTTAPSDGALAIKRTGSPAAAIKFHNASTGDTGSDGLYLGYGGSDGTIAYLYQRENDAMVFGTNNTERMRITSGGNLLIGTTTDGGYKLDVSGIGRFTSYVSFNDKGYIRGGTNTLDLQGGTTGTYIYNSSYNTVRMAILDGGNVGIGTTSPSNKLDVIGRIISSASGNQALLGASDIQSGGATVYLNSAFAGAGTPTVQVETNHPLLFATNNTERMRLDASGNLGIGLSSSLRGKLDVGGFAVVGNGASGVSTEAIRFSRSGDDFRYQSIFTTSGGSAAANLMQFNLHNFSTATSQTTVMTLNGAGAVRFNAYGSGSFTGTRAYDLSVDASGNIIEVPIGAGTITGSGTTNYIPKFTSSSAIGNSQIFDNGTNVGIGTASPNAASKLNVLSSETSTSAFGNVVMRLSSNGSGYASTLVFSDEVANSAGISMLSGNLLFGANGYDTERMRLTSGGLLGLGTSAPNSYSTNANNLVIYEAGNAGITIATGTTNEGALYFADGTTGLDVARGVVYYNHTSNFMGFATDGTERMRLDASGNLLVGGTSDALTDVNRKVISLNGTSDAIISLRYGGTLNGFIWANGSSAFQIASNNLPIVFSNGSTGGTERMRLDASGNLGLGTSAPSASYKFTISGTDAVFPGLYLNNTTNSKDYSLFVGGTSLIIRDVTSTTNRLFLDGSGNLGLGVSPSAWETTTFKAFQVGTSNGVGSLVGRADGVNNTGLTLNAYYGSGGWTYIGSSFATYYAQNNGQHIWFNAPSGTAGNAISFTQAMTLDASGRLGIGVTSPDARVDVLGTNDTGDIVRIRKSSTGSRRGALGTESGIGYLELYDDGTAKTVRIIGNGSSYITGGNVGIGTTSPAKPLHIYSGDANGNIYLTRASSSEYMNIAPYYTVVNGNDYLINVSSSNNLRLFTNDTERMRITSGGQVGINATTDVSAVAKLFINYSSADSWGFSINNTFTTSANNGSFGRFYNNGTLIGTIFAENSASDLFSVNGNNGLKFHTGSALGTERMRITSGGNVVIRSGEAVPSDGINGLFFSKVSDDSYITSIFPGIRYTPLTLNASQQIFQTNGGERMRITSAGNVLVGTTIDNGYKFNVYQSNSSLTSTITWLRNAYNNYDANPTVTYPILSLTRDGKTGITYASTAAFGVSRWENSSVNARTQLDIKLGHDATSETDMTVMSLRSNGNVGIGTTSPATTLDVNGSFRSTGLLISNDRLYLNGNRPISDWISSSLTAGYSSTNGYGWVNSQDNLVLGTNGTERMRVTSNGNIGIGTSTANYRLTVQEGGFSGAPLFAFIGNSSNSNWMRGYWLRSDGTTTLAQLTVQDGDAMYTGTITSMPYIIQTVGVERMRITSGGDVGIGTTSPFGTTTNRTVLSVNGTTDVSLNVGTGGSQRAYLYGSSTYAELGTIGSLPLTFAPNNIERMRITSGGNLLVGTTGDAGQKLQVSSSDNTRISVIETSEGITSHWGANSGQVFFTAETNHPISFYTNGSTKMHIAAAGNVGIGTTSPGYKLEVNGDIGFSGSQSLKWGGNTYIYGSNNVQLEARVNGNLGWYINSSGNVGIGTTSPGDKLTVNGGIAILAGNSIYFNNPVNTANSSILSPGGGSMSLRSYGVEMIGLSENANILFSTGGTERMRVTSAGLVGINTSSPATTLDVRGNAQVKPSTGTDAIWNRASNDSGEFYLGIDNSAGSGFTGSAYARFLYATGAYPMTFHTNNSERMRITSGGNVLVGGSSDLGYRSQIYASTNGYTQALVQTSAFSSGNLAGTVYSGYYDATNITDMASIRGGKENTTSGNFAGMLAFYTRANGGSDAERMRLTSTGELLINTTTDAGAYYLQVNGSVYATAYYESSDLRLKNVLSERQGSDGINTITFKWKDGRDSLTHIGYAAQQVEKVLPDAVKTNTDGYKTINYDEVQSLKIANLEQEIAELKKIIKQLIDKK